jgi:hypothetical protein
VAGLSRNKQETVDQLPKPKVLCVACLNQCRRGEWHMGDVSLMELPGNRATSRIMQSYTGIGSSAGADLVFLPYSWDQNGHEGDGT